MPRKIIIDCDPGVDDAVALALALFDPRLEVIAVTSCSGNVDASRATQNIQSLIERLDPPKRPRLAAGVDPEGAPVTDGHDLHGNDGLANTNWEPIGRQHLLSSDKLIGEQLRANPGEITILCLGPLTGIARAFQRDPALSGMVDRLIMTGGTLHGIGDVTPIAEFNMHFDPVAANSVVQSATTKTMVPLEVTTKLSFGLELVDSLPPKYTRVGALLHQIIPFFFRTFRHHQASETIFLQAVVALLMVTDRVLFETIEKACQVETVGELTRGATVFDRRPLRKWRNNLEVAVNIDVEAARDCFYNSLKYAGQQS